MKDPVRIAMGEIIEFKNKFWMVTKIKRKKLEVTLMSKRAVKMMLEVIQNRKEKG